MDLREENLESLCSVIKTFFDSGCKIKDFLEVSNSVVSTRLLNILLLGNLCRELSQAMVKCCQIVLVFPVLTKCRWFSERCRKFLNPRAINF